MTRPSPHSRARWRNLSLRAKGIIVVSLPIVPLVVSGVLLYSMLQAADEAEGVAARTLVVRTQLDRVSLALKDAEVHARSYVISRRPETLQDYRTTSAALTRALGELVRTLVDPAQRTRLRALIAALQDRPLRPLIEYGQATPAPATVSEQLLTESRNRMATVNSIVQQMQAAEDARLVGQRAEAQTWWNRVRLAAGVGIGLFAAGVGASLILLATLSGRIRAATRNAERLAAGAPLDPMAPAGDEVGAMAAALDRASQLLRQRDEELRRRLQDVEAANHELEAFSYSVSHDLRAPIRHIAGFTTLLQQRLADRVDDDAERYMRTITEAAARMGRLVDDLLGFSRMARAEMLNASVNLNDLLREVIDEATLAAHGRTIQWTTHPLPTIMGDRAMLRVAFSNLVQNAVKYTSNQPVAEIEIGAQPASDGRRVVWVRDNGVGFDMQYADKLFGVFQRLHPADEFEGTGIGLANVHRIVQRHGGRAWAEGIVGAGATFFVQLPA